MIYKKVIPKSVIISLRIYTCSQSILCYGCITHILCISVNLSPINWWILKRRTTTTNQIFTLWIPKFMAKFIQVLPKRCEICYDLSHRFDYFNFFGAWTQTFICPRCDDFVPIFYSINLRENNFEFSILSFCNRNCN